MTSAAAEQRQVKIADVSTLTEAQHAGLLRDVLDFFTPEDEIPNTRRIREMEGDPRFRGYTRKFLSELVSSLVMAGMLSRPPHKTTRATSYIITPIGRMFRTKNLT